MIELGFKFHIYMIQAEAQLKSVTRVSLFTSFAAPDINNGYANSAWGCFKGARPSLFINYTHVFCSHTKRLKSAK